MRNFTFSPCNVDVGTFKLLINGFPFLFLNKNLCIFVGSPACMPCDKRTQDKLKIKMGGGAVKYRIPLEMTNLANRFSK